MQKIRVVPVNCIQNRPLYSKIIDLAEVAAKTAICRRFPEEGVFFVSEISCGIVNSSKTGSFPIDCRGAVRLKYMYTFCGIKDVFTAAITDKYWR